MRSGLTRIASLSTLTDKRVLDGVDDSTHLCCVAFGASVCVVRRLEYLPTGRHLTTSRRLSVRLRVCSSTMWTCHALCVFTVVFLATVTGKSVCEGESL